MSYWLRINSYIWWWDIEDHTQNSIFKISQDPHPPFAGADKDSMHTFNKDLVSFFGWLQIIIAWRRKKRMTRKRLKKKGRRRKKRRRNAKKIKKKRKDIEGGSSFIHVVYTFFSAWPPYPLVIYTLYYNDLWPLWNNASLIVTQLK